MRYQHPPCPAPVIFLIYSQILFIIALPFIGLIKRRPLWTAVSMMVTAGGLLLCTAPFLYKDPALYDGGWNLGDFNDKFCNPDRRNITDTVSNQERSQSSAFNSVLGEGGERSRWNDNNLPRVLHIRDRQLFLPFLRYSLL